MQTQTAVMALRLVSDNSLPPLFHDCTFDDNIWYATKPNGTFKINWSRIELHNKTTLDHESNARLLYSCKLFFVLISLGHASSRRTPRGSNFESFFIHLRKLLIWMSGRGIYAFADLTLPHIVGYRNFIQNRPVRSSSRNSTDGKGASNTIAHTLLIIRYLVRVQHNMGEYGTHVDEYGLADILAGIRTKVEVPTKRIPDDLFRRCISEAITMIKDGPRILDYSTNYCKRRACAHIADTLPGGNHCKNERCRRSESYLVRYRGGTIDLAVTSLHDLRNMRTTLRGACFAVIAGLVGMRLSEIRSLRHGCLRSVPLGDGRQLLKLAGTLFKTSRSASGEPAEWVAGWDEPENPVRFAIELLQRFSKEYLFCADTTTAEQGLSLTSLGEVLSEFTRVTGLNAGWHFHPHQFRKTFARFVVLSGPNTALALMRHFKHVSIQMTERYFPNDPELMNEIIEASEELVAERLDSVFGAERLAGIKGEQIASRNESYRGPEAADARAELVRMTMADPFFRALLHVYGICLYEKEKAKCRDDVANVGLDTCMECPNAIISVEHLSFWNEQVDIIRANISAIAGKNTVDIEIYRQLERAEKIVARLSA